MKFEYRLGFPPITTNGCIDRKINAEVTDAEGKTFPLPEIRVPVDEKLSPPLILESGWTVEAKLYETTISSQAYIGKCEIIVGADDKVKFIPSASGTFGPLHKKKV